MYFITISCWFDSDSGVVLRFTTLFLYVFLKVFTFIFNQLEIIFNLFSFFCCYLKSLAYICQTINNNNKDKQKQNNDENKN